MNASAIGVTGDSTNSSTRATEMVACPDIVPAFSYKQESVFPLS
jgi:hypothetical protein